MSKAKSGKTRTKQVLSFDKLALILGFIVDSITLASILLAIDFKGSGFALPNFITPGLASVVWLLAVYTYLAFLHSYWSSHKAEEDLAETFAGFLGRDLILRFRSPWLLFPGFVSVVSLGWIMYSASHALLYIAVAVGVLTLFFGWWLYRFDDAGTRVSRKVKNRVEKEWSYLEKQIQHRLAGAQCVSYHDLQDIAEVWGVHPKGMSYALAKYAAEHPDTTRYGLLLRRDTGKLVGPYHVLVNLQSIDRDRYAW